MTRYRWRKAVVVLASLVLVVTIAPVTPAAGDIAVTRIDRVSAPAIPARAIPAPAALSAGRGLIGWGDDGAGAVGTGTTVPYATDVPDPTPVALTPALLGRSIGKVVSSSASSCALVDGDVVCWRFRGLPALADPAGVLPRGGVTDVDITDESICAVAAGRAYCWGYNNHGELGNAELRTTFERPTPVWDGGVLAGRTVREISTGGWHTCALADGRVFCWGWNANGQLGNGTRTDSPLPVEVDTGGVLKGMTIDEIATGSHGSCARAQGRVFCWGDNVVLGTDTGWEDSPIPIEIDMSGPLQGKTITRIDLDGPLACVIADARPYCWGANGSGGVGAGSTNQYEFAPLAVVTSGALAGKDVTDLVVGFGTVCVLAAGAPVCWGRNIGGEMGTGSVTDGVEPPTVADTTGALAGRRITSLGGGWWSFFAITAEPVSTGLKARANGRYVAAEAAGAAPLIANRTAVGPWEQFDLVRLGNDRVALRSRADNEWVCAENAGASSLIANRRAVGQWETFTLVRNPDATVSLRSAANGRYVVAENGGGAPLIANRAAVGPWEKFDLVTS